MKSNAEEKDSVLNRDFLISYYTTVYKCAEEDSAFSINPEMESSIEMSKIIEADKIFNKIMFSSFDLIDIAISDVSRNKKIRDEIGNLVRRHNNKFHLSMLDSLRNQNPFYSSNFYMVLDTSLNGKEELMSNLGELVLYVFQNSRNRDYFMSSIRSKVLSGNF